MLLGRGNLPALSGSFLEMEGRRGELTPRTLEPHPCPDPSTGRSTAGEAAAALCKRLEMPAVAFLSQPHGPLSPGEMCRLRLQRYALWTIVSDQYL